MDYPLLRGLGRVNMAIGALDSYGSWQRGERFQAVVTGGLVVATGVTFIVGSPVWIAAAGGVSTGWLFAQIIAMPQEPTQ